MMLPIPPSCSNLTDFICASRFRDTTRRKRVCGQGPAPPSPIALTGDDWKKQMRGVLSVAVNIVSYRFADTDVIWDIFNIAHCTRASRPVHTCDIKANAVSGLEFIRCSENLDLI